MYQFPEGLYTDVRIETCFSTNIVYENRELKQSRVKEDSGAMVRVFDGSRWYYSATTELEQIQDEINSLAAMAKPNPQIGSHPVLSKLKVSQGRQMNYEDCCVRDVSLEDKTSLLASYLPILTEKPQVQHSKAIYKDCYTVKHILSSLGTDITFDTQSCYVALRCMLLVGQTPGRSGDSICRSRFEDLKSGHDHFRDIIAKDIDFNERAVPVEPGIYTCILSPMAAGVFAHESFGHKSEADFMVGDETMKQEWTLGKQVGAPLLSIVDSGLVEGSGFVPYDDEGCPAGKTHLIKDGILSGRLHSASTAADLGDEPTGNARAINFEFEPIVRMTATYIEAGTETKEELFSKVKDGIYIEDISHGSGMTTFTIAPLRSYRIRDGKVAEPVRISVITGNVMSTLNEIDGLSDEVEILSLGTGGCGKGEQYPLPVGFGGPYVRVNNIHVQ